MTDDVQLAPLLAHLARNSRLDAAEARHLVLEVISHFSETPEAFVRRRHRELQQLEGLTNDGIFARIADEMADRPFAAPSLSRRQLRRLVYG